MATDKINTAVSKCLVSFKPGRSPFAQIADYTDRLRTQPDWTETEVQAVEWGITSFVNRVINGNAR